MNTRRQNLIKEVFNKKKNEYWIIEITEDEFLLCSRGKIQMLSEDEIADFRDDNIDEFQIAHSWMLDPENYYSDIKSYQKFIFEWMKAPEKPIFLSLEETDKQTAN